MTVVAIVNQKDGVGKTTLAWSTWPGPWPGRESCCS